MKLKLSFLTVSMLVLSGAANASIVYDAKDNVYFEYISTNETWDKANNAADTTVYNGKLGELAVITDASENSAVTALLQANNAASAWLGATNTVQNNIEDWTWSNGTQFNCTIGNSNSCTKSIYTNFSSGEPNNSGGNENALQIYSNGTWNDLNKTNISYDNPGYVVEFAGSTIIGASAAVPEPTSIVLLLAGLFSLTATARKQRVTV